MSSNTIIKSMLELLGDETPTGYAFNDIPVLLDKDDFTQYPEIRLTPFISQLDLDFQKYIDEANRKYQHWEGALFQVDIYSRSIIELQDIFNSLQRRLYDFFNLETLIYEWNPDFELIGDNVYRNISYAIGRGEEYLFKDIYGITVEGCKMNRVQDKHHLEMDTYYVNNHYLYICTKKNLKTIKIKALIQGRLFNNGDSFSDRGLHYCEMSSQRTLSALEENEVERISFDLNIIFSHKREREKLPKVNRVRYPKKHNVR